MIVLGLNKVSTEIDEVKGREESQYAFWAQFENWERDIIVKFDPIVEQ